MLPIFLTVCCTAATIGASTGIRVIGFLVSVVAIDCVAPWLDEGLETTLQNYKLMLTILLNHITLIKRT